MLTLCVCVLEECFIHIQNMSMWLTGSSYAFSSFHSYCGTTSFRPTMRTITRIHTHTVKMPNLFEFVQSGMHMKIIKRAQIVSGLNMCVNDLKPWQVLADGRYLQNLTSTFLSYAVYCVSQTELQFPLCFVKFLWRINRIQRGGGMGGKSWLDAQAARSKPNCAITARGANVKCHMRRGDGAKHVESLKPG